MLVRVWFLMVYMKKFCWETISTLMISSNQKSLVSKCRPLMKKNIYIIKNHLPIAKEETSYIERGREGKKDRRGNKRQRRWRRQESI